MGFLETEAKVKDARHLELSLPVELPVGSKVFISIRENSESEESYSLAAQGLAEAYSDHEPDYELADITRVNPDFEE